MGARRAIVRTRWILCAVAAGAMVLSPVGARSDEPGTKAVATYTARVRKGGCEDYIAVGPTFRGPMFSTADQPSATQLALDACKTAHAGAFCAATDTKDTGQPLVMAAAAFDQRCFDGGTITRIMIGFGATSDEAWQRATDLLARRSTYDPAKDTYQRREERTISATPAVAAPPLPADQWSCADGRTPKLRFLGHPKKKTKKKVFMPRVIEATHRDGSKTTVHLATILSDAYELGWGDCYERQKLAELGSLTCPIPPKLRPGAVPELAVGPDLLAAAMSKHLCGDAEVDAGLWQRAFAPMRGMLDGAARLPCAFMECKPGKPAVAKPIGTRW